MRTLSCFVITPSGKNAPMELVTDEKDGLGRVPSGCAGHSAKAVSVNFQDVYEFIILEAIEKVNAAIAARGLNIQCTRGEDLPLSGNIVSQFLQQICRAEITITDVTGLNPNVLFEYGIRLSVRDSLNLLLCHRGVILPIDIKDQRFIEYTQEPGGVKMARDEIVRTIEHSLATLSPGTSGSGEDLFRRTVEVATGRHLEKELTKAFSPSAELTADLVNEIHELGRANPKLRDRCWGFLEKLAETLLVDPSGRERAIEVYRLLTTLKGFREKRRDVFYQLNEICAADPNREEEAQSYLEQAKALENEPASL
jgi:hypothetical protein